jgi:tripartite-type tricarboxylate transporter receptor subunit TctC
MPSIPRKVAYAFTALAAALTVAAPALAADFYEGKTINLVIGTEAGTGYDLYARILARHMSKYIPGKPNIAAQNMAGAGSATAARHIFSVAPKDGTAFAILFPNAIADPLLGDAQRFRYDPTKFEYLGTADSLNRLCLTWGASKVKTFEDARQNKVTMGATSNGSSTWDYANFMNSVGGSKFEVIAGYQGSPNILLAMERGEVDGVCALDVSTVATLRPDWMGSGKVNFLLQANFEPMPALAPYNIPSIWKFVAPEHRAVAELYITQQVFGRPFMAPPGTPKDRMDILRKAFMDAWRDPELLEEARRSKLEVNPISGEEIAKVVAKMYASPPALVEAMKTALKMNH